MAKGLEGHTVSLTKNGYFKLINLIQKYPSNEILTHLDEISLDHSQARKMLAGNSNNVLPSVWDDIKKFDLETQMALLLFSIIFSHRELIDIFKDGTTAEMQGVIDRNSMDVKTYTNLAYALDQAHLAINFSPGSNETKYDLSKIFLKNEIGPLAKVLLKCHLENMGWNEPTASQPFQRTFNEQVAFYEFNKVLGISLEQLFNWLGGGNIIKERIGNTQQAASSVGQMFKKSTDKVNLLYSDKFISRFIASLITKPFVILTGLSGSGKTKLAQAFAQWLSKDDSQFRIVPVGADWTNREHLLGYPNALNPVEYVKPDNGVLDLIIKANQNQDLPYFLILDEMNLSHVERYFADFLSVMESKSHISLFDESIQSNGVPSKILLPYNLFIIGTVNIDETTNMFSPKVLDRANTIEFRVNKEEIEGFLSDIKDIDMNTLNAQGADMADGFLQLVQNKVFEIPDLSEVNKTLIGFFEQLKKTGAEFGYRTATEILRLISQLTLLNSELTSNEKLDIAIIQKLLPKLHGSRRKLCPVLVTLGSFCITTELKDVEKDVFNVDDFDFNNEVNVKFPLSLEKIYRMHKGAIDNGFASFAEA